MRFTNYLKSIDGVAIYPIISLVMFVSIFLLAAVYVYTTDKKRMERNANIPLQKDSDK